MKTLESFAWPGGYALCYEVEGATLCVKCASRAAEEGAKPSPFIHWEGESLWCDDCGVEMPSEYGDPEQDKEESA